MTKKKIGTGRLTWSGQERRSDRYGFVFLLNSGDSTTPGMDCATMHVDPNDWGKKATLSATVVEVRMSTHIGDLFRGIGPSTPEIGDVLVLGSGLLASDDLGDGDIAVGLKPVDHREFDWLDPHALYRCHEQTVDLFYELA